MTKPNLAAILQSYGIECEEQTPSLAAQLLQRGQIKAEDFFELSPDIERNLMEAFIEDDYDGKLHLTTLSRKDVGDTGSSAQQEIVGISFWREVPSVEMSEWLDLQRISQTIAGRKLASSPSFTSYEEHDSSQNSMELVLSDSMGWIKNALLCCRADDAPSAVGDDLPSTSTIINMLRHEWIKIELIAIKRSHRARHLGRILMGLTLAQAHTLHDNEHVILHIAGGGASTNVPAARLYKRYGFVPVPRHKEGGPFSEPDKDLCVLENIGMVLESLPLDEMIEVRNDPRVVQNDCCKEEVEKEKKCAGSDGKSFNRMFFCCDQ